MSTSYNIYVVYGFKSDSPVLRDRKTGEATYLSEWLEDQSVPDEIQQFNAGVSNGGSPDYFVGVSVARLKDFTRTREAYLKLPRELPLLSATLWAELTRVQQLLRDLSPDLAGELGYYLIGDAA